jgi:two-component system, OmpR family, response regulator
MHAPDTRPKVLLVDDDEDFLFQHRIQLEAAGFEVAAAASRREAEEKIKTFRPDLAVLDLMMEHHDDGFVLSHHLKRSFPGLPVILVTAVTSETGLVFDPSSPEERAWVGADALLAKPIRFEQLQREIDRLMAAHKQG